jgi:hypothetical protein
MPIALPADGDNCDGLIHGNADGQKKKRSLTRPCGVNRSAAEVRCGSRSELRLGSSNQVLSKSFEDPWKSRRAYLNMQKMAASKPQTVRLLGYSQAKKDQAPLRVHQ